MRNKQTKRRSLFIIALAALIGFTMVGCEQPADSPKDDGPPPLPPPYYRVIFSAINVPQTSGTLPPQQTVISGSSITLPSGSGLTLGGYTFGGWNTKVDGTGTTYAAGSSYTVTEQTIFYIKWNANDSYTVTFDANGATSGTTPAPQTVRSGLSISLPPGNTTGNWVNYLIKIGCTFGGWNTKADGTGTNYTGSYPVTGDITLYAKWNDVGVIPLTENQWADGNITSSGSEQIRIQWFTFTATAATQYIHVKFGTLKDLYVQVYDSSGATVGSETNLYGYNFGDETILVGYTSTSRSLTAGQTYYIRVRPYSGSGTYQIGFTAIPSPPGTIIPLTENQWADGNLLLDEWFTFTATSSTQYIHISTSNLSVRVQVYDSNGETVGSEETYVNFFSIPGLLGQTYYIRVRPYSGSDTYRIGFNGSTTAPPQ
jgi:uncharacterized repeat protein (TIGR02543 family)